MTTIPPHSSGSASTQLDRSSLNQFIQIVSQELLTQIQIESSFTNNPVIVKQLPTPWQLLGAGNYDEMRGEERFINYPNQH